MEHLITKKTPSYRVGPNSEIARILLAFLATAGLFYVNIMPALVNGLVDGLGLSKTHAGYISSANVYGAAVGALAVVFMIAKIQWRKTAYMMLAGLIICDLVSMSLTSMPSLVITRFIHGVIGGALVGVGFAVISRTSETDRTFGYLLSIQFGLGGLGLYLLPPLVPEYGTAALFWALIAFSVVTLLMVPFLDEYEHTEKRDTVMPTINLPIVLTLAAIFCFQAANMAIYAFTIEMGKFFEMDITYISETLGEAAWIAILGSVLVILMSTKYGRLWPVTIAILLTAIGIWAFHYSKTTYVFWLANVAVGITWAFVISYLLGLCSAFDRQGQVAALGGFASKMGLASGPFVAGLLTDQLGYASLINISAVILVVAAVLALVPMKLIDQQEAEATNSP